MNSPSIIERRVRKFAEGKWSEPEPDLLTVEEPLEIRVGGKSLAVIMRTPGDDVALAAGFLLTEGIVADAREIGAIAYCRNEGETQNVINVALAEGVPYDAERFRRNFYASSSCGICGKASIEAIASQAPPVRGDWRIKTEILVKLPEALRGAQEIFAETGSLHAAGLFDLQGNLTDAAEDVGRHNAVDKVIGRAVLADRLPLDRSILMVSGRISFEIVQKAVMTGVPLVAAVSGASSLAVEVAEDRGMTLAGFVRGNSLKVYCGSKRLED